MNLLNQFSAVKIVYCSVTGSIEKVADLFRENLMDRVKQVEIEKISLKNNSDSKFNGDIINNLDCLILVSILIL